MKSLKIIVIMGLFILVGACSKGGPEGTYSIDKSAMKKAFETEVAKMPKAQKAMASMFKGMIDSMKVDLTLKKDGKMTIKSEMSFGGKTKKDTEEGTWKVEGKNITLSGKKTMTCEFSGSEITCKKSKKMPFAIVYKKS